LEGEKKPIAVIGVPMDLGGRRRGTDMGPSAIRYAGLDDVLRSLGYSVRDLGNLEVAVRDTQEVEDPRIRYLPEVSRVCLLLAQRVEEVVREGRMSLVLGGDHSVAIGTVGGLIRAGWEPAILWFDAHGDFNTPDTTPSGSIHGMPLAVVTGRGHPALVSCCQPGIPEERCALIGVRNLDPLEREALKVSRVNVYTMKEVDERGIAVVVREAAERVSRGGRHPLHLTVDMDVVDPSFAPGVGSPEPGGLTYREAHLAMELLAETGWIGSVEVTEVNPILDVENRTAKLAVELVASALGKTIL